MKNWKKMIVTAAAFGALTLFAGCTTASAVSLEEAKDLVKTRVGDQNAVVVEHENDRDDGVYELEIIVNGVGYEFEVDSRTGDVREVEREALRPTETAPTDPKPVETQPESGRISLEEAKAIAYSHAGVSESEAYDKSYDADDGKYEIDFDCGGYEYEYDISYEGKILSSHREKEHDHHRTFAPAESKPAETQPGQTEPARITAREALAAALTHAGVSDARDKDAEWDDGRWEVSFESGGTEYEYNISADGKVLSWEKENDD